MNVVEQDANYVGRVKTLLGDDGFAQIYAPIESGSGLPNPAFSSQEWFALEQDRIFRRYWIFAGAEAEIPKTGDIKPVEIGGVPVILVRGQDGAVRCFQNVCRHRGSRLVSEHCNRKTITCPYHAWTYGLDGSLRARPHFNGPDRGDMFRAGGGCMLDLLPVRAESFHGCVFVDLSGAAEPLGNWLAIIAEDLTAYDLASIRWAGKLEFEVAANWKFVYENYIENYHVFAIHPRLTDFAPMDIRGAGKWRGNTFKNGYSFPKEEQGRGQGMPHYPGLSDEDRARGIWFLTMPHFALEVFPDQFTVLVAYPVAPGLTREELHVFLIGDEAATGERFADGRQEIFRMWDDLNREDLSVLPLLQQGRKCPGYDGGRLSPHWDGPTLEYARKIVDLIVAA